MAHFPGPDHHCWRAQWSVEVGVLGFQKGSYVGGRAMKSYLMVVDMCSYLFAACKCGLANSGWKQPDTILQG